MTSVMFINHSSLLIKYGDRYLLTDPWYNQPALAAGFHQWHHMYTLPILLRWAKD